MTTRRRPRPPFLAPLAPLALVVLVLAACTSVAGGDGVASLDDPAASPAAASAPAASVDPEQAMLDFARCMRENGVDMPDPGTDGSGRGFVRVGGPGEEIDPETLQAAQEACQHLMADIVGEGGPQLSEEQKDQMLEFAQCMREHGVDMPDPQFDDGNGRFSARMGGDGLDPTSPEFQDAQEACGEILGGAPGMRFGGGPANGAAPDGDQ
jgi:hypothetical protein